MSQFNTVNGTTPQTAILPAGSTKLSRHLPPFDTSLPNDTAAPIQFPDLDPAILQAAQVTLTAAQIKALHTTPITLIAAQGANTIIDVETIIAKLAFGTTQYTGTNAIETRFTNASGAKAAADIGSTFLNGSANAVDQVGGVTTEVTPVANAAIVLSVPTANPAAGDSPVTFTVFYRVISGY